MALVIQTEQQILDATIYAMVQNASGNYFNIFGLNFADIESDDWNKFTDPSDEYLPGIYKNAVYDAVPNGEFKAIFRLQNGSTPDRNDIVLDSFFFIQQNAIIPDPSGDSRATYLGPGSSILFEGIVFPFNQPIAVNGTIADSIIASGLNFYVEDLTP